jgi:drug/metabolite transporter (DMT)-like permease
MGLAMINSSTYMMIKGTSIVTTAFFSWILMKMKLQKRHFIGCGLAILGLVIVGSSAFILKDTTGK